MIKKKLVNHKNIDLFFMIVVFILPLISKIFFNISTTNTRVLFVFIVAFWGIYKCLFSKINSLKILIIDIGIFILLLYTMLHFCYHSEASIYYYKIWIYIAYAFLFYLFRWSLSNTKKASFIIKGLIIAILIISCFEILVAFLQYFGAINAKNDFFSLLGSFTSPNFFGAFVGLNLIILIWVYFVKNIKKLLLKKVIILGLLIYLGVILLSGSRSTLLALIISSGVLVITSKKSMKMILQVSFIKKLLLSFILAILTIVGIVYLYNLKPESVRGRAFIAKISSKEIAKYPVAGYGLFSFAGKYNKAKASYFEAEERSWDETKIATYAFTPFNDYLLIVFELGVLGLTLVIFPIIYVMKKTKINKKTRLGLAILINVCVLAFFNSVISSSVLVSFGLFGLVLVLSHGNFKKEMTLPNNIGNYILKPLVIIISFSLSFLILFKLINQSKFKDYQVKKGSKAELIFLSRAIEDNMYSGQTVGLKLFYSNYKDDGIKYIEEAFNKTSAPRIGKKLATLYIQQGNFKRAEEIFKFNMNVEPYRYEAKMDLISLYKKTKQHEKLIKMSQEVINFPIKVQSRTIDKYKQEATNNIEEYHNVLE